MRLQANGMRGESQPDRDDAQGGSQFGRFLSSRPIDGHGARELGRSQVERAAIGTACDKALAPNVVLVMWYGCDSRVG